MANLLTAINLTRDVRLTERGRVADSFSTRLVGLLRDKTLATGDGLWIVPCNSIHSIGMQFVFDAIFLDKKTQGGPSRTGNEAVAHLEDRLCGPKPFWNSRPGLFLKPARCWETSLKMRTVS